jgi:hypothetical protein
LRIPLFANRVQLCVSRDSEYTANISLNSKIRLVSVAEIRRVFYEVRTEYISIIQKISGLQIIKMMMMMMMMMIMGKKE